MRKMIWTMVPGMVLGLALPAHAGDPLADEIVRALTGGNKLEERANTRSLSGSFGKSSEPAKKSFRARSFVSGEPASDAQTRAIQKVKGTLLIQPGDNDKPAGVDTASTQPPAIQAPGALSPTADLPSIQAPVIQTPAVQAPSGKTGSGQSQTAAVPLPSYDLYVTFPFASHALTGEAKRKLASVAAALKHPNLADKAIQIAGHTDSVGKAENNMRLSINRAEAVRDYLTANHGIDRARIRTIGHGETKLKDKSRPRSGVNRRVELVNLGNTIASAN